MKCLVLILSLFLNFAAQAAVGEPAIGLSIRPGAGGNPDAPPPGPSLSDRQSELDALTKLLQQANPKPEVKKIDWEKIDREEAAAEEAELLAYGEQRRREWAEKPVYVEETKAEKELREIVKETCGFYDPFFDPAEHIADLYAKRDFVKNQITRMDKREIRERLVKTATETIEVADDLYKKDELEEGWNVARYAHKMLDLATSLTPGVSWGRDVYEAISGVDLISNEKLGLFSRSISIFGAATGGLSSIAFGCIKSIKITAGMSRILNIAKISGGKRQELVETVKAIKANAVQVGVKTAQEVRPHVETAMQVASNNVFLRPKLRDYLLNVNEVPREQLIKDLEQFGWKFKRRDLPGYDPAKERFLEFVDSTGLVRAKIHPPDAKTLTDHLHIYDSKGRSVNDMVKLVKKKSPDAHIEIQESL